MAATRVAIVGTDAGAEAGKVLDLAIAEFKDSKDIEVLERAQIDHVLREQELSLGNRAPDAERAVKAGQLLRVDLFAVLEGGGPEQLFGVVVFDAQTGVRYADAAVAASNVLSAARGMAKVIEQATGKSRRRSTDLRTVGVLSVRNADLPRAYDSLCDAAALLLERELVAAPDIAVLERRRLEHISRERGVANGAGDALLPSLRMLELEFARDGAGVRASVVLTSLAGQFRARTNVSIATLDTATLSRRLAEAVAGLLDAKMPAVDGGRFAEAQRFGREAEIRMAQSDYMAALRALDAAYALDPADTNFQYQLVRLLPDAAIEFIDPGGQRGLRALPRKPSDDEILSALALGNRGLDLLREFCGQSVAAAKPDDPTPAMLRMDAYARFNDLLGKLADPQVLATPFRPDIDALARKHRALHMEVIEPFLRSRVHDAASFRRISRSGVWTSFIPYFGETDPTWKPKAVAAALGWLELAAKYNPGDGRGNYEPLAHFTRVFAEGSQTPLPVYEPVWAACESSGDPVVRAYAKLGRALPKLANRTMGESVSDEMLEAVRTLRLSLQEDIARLPASGTNQVRGHLFQIIEQTLGRVRYHRQEWKEYMETCRFALEQQEARSDLFKKALPILAEPRNSKGAEAYELSGDILKAIADRPAAFADRVALSALCREYRERFAPLTSPSGSQTNSPAPWVRSTKLFEPSPERDGLGWVFKPLAAQDAIYAAGLGLEGPDLKAEALQLVRIPLDGTPVSLLARVAIRDAIAANMHHGAEVAWVKRPEGLRTMQVAKVPRAACLAQGRYFLATHLGVFMFPTNGEPAQRLCTTNALPTDDIHSLAVLNGKLYIGAGDVPRSAFLLEYDLATAATKTIASSRRKETASAFDGQEPYYPAMLWADEPRRRILLLAGFNAWKSPSSGLWSFAPESGQFRQLASFEFRQTYVDQSLMMWGGPVAPDVLGIFRWGGQTFPKNGPSLSTGFSGLWDARTDQFIAQHERMLSETNQEPAPLWPASKAAWTAAPLMLHDGWLWWAQPFRRASMDGTKIEDFPALPGEKQLRPTEALQLIDQGRRVLAADRFGVWVLELSSEESVRVKPTSGNTP